MSTTCLPCAFLNLVPVGTEADVVAIGTMAYLWAHQQPLEEACRGFCAEHERLFKAGVLRAQRDLAPRVLAVARRA